MTVQVDNTGRHYIYNEDCTEVLKGFAKHGLYTPDLVFMDPPFNIGQQYDTHNDNMPQPQFDAFIGSCVYWGSCVLRKSGLLLVHIPDHMVAITLEYIKYNNKMFQYSERMEQVGWIIWHYRFAQHCRGRFIPSKMHCLVFRKGSDNHTFNDEQIMEQSDRASKYNDKRTLDSATPGMRNMFDVWTDIPRLTGNSKERVAGDNPNQLPEAYIERLLLAYTNPDDTVVDMFGGTFTVASVCKRLGNKSLTCEISENYCKAGLQRINNV